MWQAMFGITNLVALAMWVVLIALPRRPFTLALVLYAGVALLCLAYASGLGWVLATTGGGGGDFTTIEGVRSMFATDAGVAIGWTHYLALDLFAGLWIARDADAKKFSRLVQAPVLLLTFIAGPAGLLIWLVVRERRARGPGGWTSKKRPTLG
ncbi:ABA4-like family protein [Tsuneonella amylolytica]|uniref:ABA4-like family protein n=1 Tax=Tsuneonella amylolytica TaxID=2338327 RepID=UPI000EA91B37|nr:ABA4-like family protein [Tsuneonella amylolytica]